MKIGFRVSLIVLLLNLFCLHLLSGSSLQEKKKGIIYDLKIQSKLVNERKQQNLDEWWKKEIENTFREYSFLAREVNKSSSDWIKSLFEEDRIVEVITGSNTSVVFSGLVEQDQQKDLTVVSLYYYDRLQNFIGSYEESISSRKLKDFKKILRKLILKIKAEHHFSDSHFHIQNLMEIPMSSDSKKSSINKIGKGFQSLELGTLYDSLEFDKTKWIIERSTKDNSFIKLVRVYRGFGLDYEFKAFGQNVKEVTLTFMDKLLSRIDIEIDLTSTPGSLINKEKDLIEEVQTVYGKPNSIKDQKIRIIEKYDFNKEKTGILERKLKSLISEYHWKYKGVNFYIEVIPKQTEKDLLDNSYVFEVLDKECHLIYELSSNSERYIDAYKKFTKDWFTKMMEEE